MACAEPVDVGKGSGAPTRVAGSGIAAEERQPTREVWVVVVLDGRDEDDQPLLPLSLTTAQPETPAVPGSAADLRIGRQPPSGRSNDPEGRGARGTERR